MKDPGSDSLSDGDRRGGIGWDCYPSIWRWKQEDLNKGDAGR